MGKVIEPHLRDVIGIVPEGVPVHGQVVVQNRFLRGVRLLCWRRELPSWLSAAAAARIG